MKKIKSIYEKSEYERFWSNVDKECSEFFDCWEWTGFKTRWGYGGFSLNHKSYLAHRVAWELVNGKIPEGMCVLHECDNKKCVNPDHLKLGTHQDNTDDMMLRNRSCSKLSPEDVIAIRILCQCGYTMQVIAKMYDVGKSTICRISLRQVFKE